MKKLALVAVATLGGVLVYRRIAAEKAEDELWAEATDPIDLR